MSDKPWKQGERRTGARYGTTRTVLSGGNNPQAKTRSDTGHARLFIERKTRARLPFWTTWLKVRAGARAEDKTPIFVMHRKASPFELAIMDADYHAALERIVDCLLSGDTDGAVKEAVRLHPAYPRLPDPTPRAP